MRQSFIIGVVLGLIICMTLSICAKIEEKRIEQSMYRLEEDMSPND